MPPVLAAAIWDAMAVGQLFGGCLASLISLTAIVVSASLMQRPRTNRVGGAALLLALVGWLVGGAGGVAALLAPAAGSQVVAFGQGFADEHGPGIFEYGGKLVGRLPGLIGGGAEPVGGGRVGVGQIDE